MDINTEAKKEKILIVDDEKAVREFLERFLRQKGFTNVSCAQNGEEALLFLEQEKRDVVFLDIKMPGVNGIKILRKIKAKYPETSVIMITAYAEREIAEEALKEGAYDYITKPFNLSYLELSLLSKIATLNKTRGDEL
ncbi:MAG: response regulator [Candidatus Omnitrophica bacterium]|nr:response regulator [Candidatus Omnitrophota bacterium]